MALSVPLIALPDFEKSCIGNFFRTDCKHLATPNGHCIDFQIAELGKTSVCSNLSKRVMGHGSILKSFKVSTGRDGLDILAVYTRGMSQDSKVILDRIQFLRFKETESDLVPVGNFECEILKESMTDLPASEISVCSFLGLSQGTVIYSNGHIGRVNMIDPLSFTNVSSHVFSEFLTPVCPLKSFWLSENEIAFAREAKYMTHLAFARVTKYGGGSKPSRFKLKVFAPPASLKPHPERVSDVASFGSGSQRRIAVIYPKTVFFLKNTKSTVKEDNSINLPFAECRGRQWWSLGNPISGVICVSSDQKSFYVGEDLVPKTIEFEAAMSTRIKPLGSGNHFLLEKDGSTRIGFAKLEFEPTRRTIVQHVLKPQSSIFRDFELSSQFFDATFGSEYRANFRYSHSPGTLIRSRKASNMQHSTINDLLEETVVSIGALNAEEDLFLVSTKSRSYLFQLKTKGTQISMTEVNAPPWVNLESPSIFAQSGVQITPDELRRKDAMPYRFDVPGITSASVNASLTIMTTVCDLFLITEDLKTFKLSFDNAIVAFDVSEKILAVLTSHSMALYHLDTLSNNMVPHSTQHFAAAATCLLKKSEENYVVGFSDGSALILPENRLLQLSSGSICSLYWHENLNSLVISSSEGINIYDFQLQIVIEGPRGNFSSFTHSTTSSFGLVTRNGALEAIELRQGFGYIQEISYDACGQSNANFGMHYSSNMIALDSELRKITTCDGNNLSLQKVGSLPATPGDLPAPNSQLFLLDDSRLLEVAHSPCDKNEPERDFDDFEVMLKINLFQFAIEDESITVTCLSSVSTRLSGDPYDEITVKFIAPSRFTIFTHSVECIPCEISGRDIRIGKPSPANDYVYDDNWIFDKGRDCIYVIDFNGRIHSEPFDRFKIGKEAYPCSEESTNISDVADCMVFDALMTNYAREHDLHPRFAVTTKRPNNEPITDLRIFDYDRSQEKVIPRASIILPSREVKILQVCSKMHEWLKTKTEALRLRYKFTPEVIASTSNGSIYMVAYLQDPKLQTSLQKIQERLTNDLGILVSRNHLSSNSDMAVLDGSILNDALAVPELRSLFLEHDVDPDQLQLSMNLLYM